jgi:hypothetical protein
MSWTQKFMDTELLTVAYLWGPRLILLPLSETAVPAGAGATPSTLEETSAACGQTAPLPDKTRGLVKAEKISLLPYGGGAEQ